MADPLSIAGLVIAIGQVISSLSAYVRDVKDARSDIQKLSVELFTLKGVLESLQDLPFDDNENEVSISLKSAHFQDLASLTAVTIQSLEARLQFPKSRLGKTLHALKWPFDGAEFGKLLIRLERIKTSYILVFMRSNAVDLSDIVTGIQQIRLELQGDREEQGKLRRAAADQLLIEWLSGPLSQQLHAKAYSAYHPGTGQWFLTEIEKWVEHTQQSGSILWLNGPSGIGKTTLMSRAIEYFVTKYGSEDDVATAFHYCSISDTTSQRPESVLSSAAAQIAVKRPDILDALRPDYEKDSRLNLPRSLTVEQIVPLLTSKVQDMRLCLLFVDAINEGLCSRDIVSSLLSLVQQNQGLHVVISSTSEPAVPELLNFSSLYYIKVEPSRTSKDIATFVSSELANNKDMQHLSDSLKGEILQKLTMGADGMFRWARLALAYLSSQRTNRAIRNALSQIPDTLNEVYESILCRISSSDRLYAKQALMWLSFSDRPLSIKELNEAAILDESLNTIEKDDRLHSEYLLLEWCHGLIMSDGHHVYLAHSSVRTFLISDWIKSSKAKYFALDINTTTQVLMRLCLTYLLFSDFRRSNPGTELTFREEAKQFPLLRYAVRNWLFHAYDLSTIDYQKIDAFFKTRHKPNGGNFTHWVSCLIPKSSPSDIQNSQPLYYAASFGVLTIVEFILNNDPLVEIDAPGGRNRSSALVVASTRGHASVVKLLLKAGADPTCVGADGRGAYDWAVINDWPIVQSLLRLRFDYGLAHFKAHCNDFGDAVVH